MERHEHGEHPGRAILHRGVIGSPEITTHAFSPFFNYGRGFFETILYESGNLWYFEEHLERMRRTCSDFHITLDFSEISEPLILGYLETIGLKDHCSRIKILYAPVSDALRWETVVTAAPYTPPAKDLTLSVHNEVYDSALSRYKSLNYQYNLHWREYYGKKEGSDEVLFYGRNGRILEGSYTNLLYLKDSVLRYVDKGNNYLHGIMQDRLLSEAEKMEGISIEAVKEGIAPDDLGEADEVMICNSLMTVQNVKKIIHGDRVYTWPSSPSTDYLAPKLRKRVLKGDTIG